MYIILHHEIVQRLRVFSETVEKVVCTSTGGREVGTLYQGMASTLQQIGELVCAEATFHRRRGIRF